MVDSELLIVAERLKLDDWEKDCVMTLSEFVDSVDSGCFIDYDGHGYFVYNGGESMSDIEIVPSSYKSRLTPDVTHVVWYNR